VRISSRPEDPSRTFHEAGKLNASASVMFCTAKSLNTNHGLVRSSRPSASGTEPFISGVDGITKKERTLDNRDQMRILLLVYNLDDKRLQQRSDSKIYSCRKANPERIYSALRIVDTLDLTV
jgi:hypothetical protein